MPGRIARRGALPLRSSFGRQRSTRPCHASPVALGLISDLHGNRVALEAVVSDGVAAGVDRWWVLGDVVAIGPEPVATLRSEEHTSELQSLMRISYAVFCLKKKKHTETRPK